MGVAKYEAAWRAAQSLRHRVDPCGENPPVDLPEAVWVEIRSTNAPTLGAAIERATLDQMRGEKGLTAAGLFPSIFNGLCDLAQAVRGDPILSNLSRTTFGRQADRAVYRRSTRRDDGSRGKWRVLGTHNAGNQASELKDSLCRHSQGASLCPPSAGDNRASVFLGLQVLDGEMPPRLRLDMEPRGWPPGSPAPSRQSIGLTSSDLGAAVPPGSFLVFVDGLLRVMRAAEALDAPRPRWWPTSCICRADLPSDWPRCDANVARRDHSRGRSSNVAHGSWNPSWHEPSCPLGCFATMTSAIPFIWLSSS